MVFNGKIDAKTKALVKFLREESLLTVQEITKRCGVSRGTVYRCLKADKTTSNKKSPGRPRKISSRDERMIERNIKKLRRTESNFCCERLRAESGLHHVSLHTFNRTLKRLGYRFCDARRKGISNSADRSERVKFAREVRKHYSEDLWKRDICFYLDGVSFWHKLNPLDDARSPQGKIWWKRSEGLSPDCTAKGAHTGSGGRVLKMIVAISYSKGVIFCEQYDKLDGDYYANFIRRNFTVKLRKSGKRNSKLFLQDNCPIQNCAKARKALKAIGAKLFAIPPRSPDLNPIENLFNIVKRELKRQAIRKHITFETFKEFSELVKSTLYAMNTVLIDNIISSMDKRLQLIIQDKGKRTKY